MVQRSYRSWHIVHTRSHLWSARWKMSSFRWYSQNSFRQKFVHVICYVVVRLSLIYTHTYTSISSCLYTSSKCAVIALHFVTAERSVWCWCRWWSYKLSDQWRLEQEVRDLSRGHLSLQSTGICTGENPHLPPSTWIVLRNVVVPRDTPAVLC